MAKGIVTLGATVGSLIGGYIPSMWGDNGLSIISLIFGTIGGILGIWIGYKCAQYLES